jgi:PKD repeat protein
LTLFILAFTTTCTLNAQHQGSYWVLPNDMPSGLDFRKGGDSIFAHAPFSVFGSNDLSDGNRYDNVNDTLGNLCFYADHGIIRNRETTRIKDLYAWPWTFDMKSFIMLPDPYQDSIYWEFAGGVSIGFRRVSMVRDSGRGDLTQKPRYLYNPKTLGMSAIKHANGKDIWLVAKEWKTDGYMAFLLGANGLDTIPVMSYSGNSSSYSETFIRVRPDMNQTACSYGQYVEFMKFDRSTGKFINDYGLYLNSQPPYGMDYSSDGTKFYIVENGGAKIYHYDLSSGVDTTIQQSEHRFSVVGEVVGLQRGPDCRIYFMHKAQYPALGVVANPNGTWQTCGLRDTLMVLPFSYQYGNGGGLPNIPVYLMARNKNKSVLLKHSQACKGDSMAFEAMFCSAGTYHWQFGDGDTSSLRFPKHIYADTGTYTVSVISENACGTDTIVGEVVIKSIPSLELGNDTVLCTGQSLTLSAPAQAGVQPTWQDGSGGSKYAVTQSGKYSLKINNGYCSRYDSIQVSVYPLPVVNLGADTVLCGGNTLTLNAGLADRHYTWNSGDTLPTITATTSGTFMVKVNDGFCQANDSIHILFQPLPHPFISSIENTLAVPNIYSSYQWFMNGIAISGAINNICYTNAAGNYFALVSDGYGCSGISDTFSTNIGLPRQETHNGIYIYPNPTKELFTLELKNLAQGQLTLTNMLGQVVLNQAVKENKTLIDISKLPKGIYIVNLTSYEGDGYKQMLVKE